MLIAQRDSLRLLRGILAASVIIPAALFGYASWLGYYTNAAIADRQISQVRDVMTEHALKVFESVERSLAEIDEMTRGQSDAEISERQAALHQRLLRISDGSDQIKSMWIFGRDGRVLVNSLNLPAPGGDFSDRDYFRAHVERDIGTYIGEILRPRPPYGGAPFFGVSRRRSSADGSFAGVIQASLLPDYFEGFYAKIGQEAGSYAALIREDGTFLARYPRLERNMTVPPTSLLLKELHSGRQEGDVVLTSAIDGLERKLVHRRLPRFPVFVVAGIETKAVRAGWLRQLASYLIFGLPATAALIALVMLTLKRTRNLYDEASRRASAETALRQSQRLESLGRLTGGVAHDFNNLLMVVGGSVERLRRRHGDDQDRRAFDMIDSAVAKGSALTRQLLSFSRRHSVSAKSVNLARCIEKFSDVMRQSIRSDIALDIKQLDPDICAKIDPNEFEIALLNLTLNARDAMPDGGRITIVVGSATFAENGPGGLLGDLAWVCFSDTGAGIAPDIRDRIFEPFFTTKPVDRGTGLGLSQIYGFIQQSGGAIIVESEVGCGATFHFYLPRCEPPAETESADTSPMISNAESATMLLVEDHPGVSAVAADYAQQCGYHVIHANSAETAVEILNKRSDIDLVFSDIVMPGMSGLELGRLIRAQHPDLPVVLTSGYSDRTATALSEGFPLLQKPYTLDALRKAVADGLAAHRTAAEILPRPS